MLLTTTETIPGRTYEIIGLVRGSTVQCKNYGHDLFSGLQDLVSGEMNFYADLMEDARKIATHRMTEQALDLGADAIVCVRCSGTTLAQGAAEITVYGTAVRFV